MSDAAAFEFVDDVTSDLSFVARGETLPAVFAAAATALLDATIEELERIAEVTRDHAELIDVRITGRATPHHRHGGQEVHIMTKD